MSGGLAELVAGVYHCTDLATRDDWGARTTFRRDKDGNLHLLDVELIEPRRVTIEARLVPGSSPPRYEPT